ncbi:penicillin-binding protein 1A [Alkanindiges sp. WGS2144]|uniref:penicillin-binding protein 1A n=1 Tax=Alkanindiges sp. WGS2144 TaxID=3366808 RepID=UPI00375190D4
MKKLSCSGRIHPVFLLVIVMAMAIPMGFYGMYLYIYPSLPDMTLLKEAPLEQPLQVYTRDNELIAEFGEKLSIPVIYEDIPPTLVQAFLAAEDSSFFEHSGVSFKGLGRAVSETISGGAQTGGSTITMQVAKNYYLSPERTLRRKLTEIFLARKIEQSLSKEDILTLYVNKIFLGKNAYGIAAAARIYYNKELKDLTVAEMAMVAGLPKAPSRYNPVANPERALERRNWILARMLQLAAIDQATYQQAVAEPIKLNMREHRVATRFPYLAELIRAEMVKRFGEQVTNSGYKVYTTVDSKRQASAETAVKEGLEAYDRRHGWRGAEANDKPLSQFFPYANTWPAKVVKVDSRSFDAEFVDGKKVTIPWSGMSWARRYYSADRIGGAPDKASQIVKLNDIVRLRPNDNKKTSWRLTQIPAVQGQLIALNPNNGAVEAIVGGYDFAQSKFNRATQGWRQPGSTIKPFIYTLALERGMTPYSIVSDSPLSVGKWHPKNSDGRFLGNITLRRALYLSRNLVSIRLLQTVGLDRARHFLVNFGLVENKIPRNLTIALGTPQVLPIQMATGYAAFANGGFRIQPFVIEKVLDNDDNLLFEVDPAYACASCQTSNDQPADTPTDEKPATDATDDVVELTNKPGQAINKTSTAATTTTPANDANPSQVASTSAIKTYRQAERIIKSSSAFDMASILQDVIMHGTGRAALKLGRDDLGGKTGTTNDAKDAWFAGFNGNLVTVTWVGFDTPKTLGRREYGGIAALPIWIDFMGAALKDTPSKWVTLDRNADDPDLLDPVSSDVQRKQRRVPPMATPLYKPKPLEVTVVDDFADLPDMGINADAFGLPDSPAPAKPAGPSSSTPATPSSPPANKQATRPVLPSEIF